MISEAHDEAEKYIRVFDSVASRRDLLPVEKLLLSLVAGLSVRRGHCDGSNRYLAMRLGTEAGYISELLVGLKNRGLIEVEIDRASGNARRIRLCGPIGSQQRTYPVTAGEGITPQPERSPARTGNPTLSQPEHRIKKNQNGIKKEKKDQTPDAQEGGEESVFQPSVQEAGETKTGEMKVERVAPLREMGAQYRDQWQALGYAEKLPFIEKAAADLAAAGITDPPPRAVEPRAFTLYAKDQARAWIANQPRG